MKRFRLSRRAWLRGAAGTGIAIGLCPLEAMLNDGGTALADGSPLPARLITFHMSNGVILDSWHPGSTGALRDLPAATAPLMEVAPHVRMMSGFNCRGGHRRGHLETWMGKDGGDRDTDWSVTIDQIMASQVGSATRFPSLQYGLFKDPRGGYYLRSQSNDQDGNFLPMEFQTDRAFTRLFGGPDPDEARRAREERRTRSVLDAVRTDLGSLRSRLGRADLHRLDRHLTSIEELERSLFAGPSAACGTDRDVAELGADDDAAIPARSRQFNELMTLAFQCDQTRVIGYTFSQNQNKNFLRWLEPRGLVHSFRGLGGTPTGNLVEWHGWTHTSAASWGLPIISRWVVEEFVDLVQRLAAAEEGDGRLIDNTIVFLVGENGDGDSHGCDDLPVVLAGGARFLDGGRHYRGRGQHTAQISLAVLDALGVRIDRLLSHSGRAPLRG